MLFVLSEYDILGPAIVGYACEGSIVSWPSLACLRSIFSSAKGKVYAKNSSIAPHILHTPLHSIILVSGRGGVRFWLT